MINETELKKFIFESGKHTYASGDASIKTKEADGSTTIVYTDGRYKVHDNYFGGEPYGGREVIFLDDKAIWMMVYYGWVKEGVNRSEQYAFLMEALLKAPEDVPYRGPALYEKGNLKYENTFSGEVGQFSGTEKIFQDGVCVYEARYVGGYVDQ